jgi:hypothetical protein
LPVKKKYDHFGFLFFSLAFSSLDIVFKTGLLLMLRCLWENINANQVATRDALTLLIMLGVPPTLPDSSGALRWFLECNSTKGTEE